MDAFTEYIEDKKKEAARPHKRVVGFISSYYGIVWVETPRPATGRPEIKPQELSPYAADMLKILFRKWENE